jgi:hypothetical protein
LDRPPPGSGYVLNHYSADEALEAFAAIAREQAGSSA